MMAVASDFSERQVVVPDIYDDTYAYDLAGYVGQNEKVSAAWGDCITIVPWIQYLAFGDEQLLAENFQSGKGRNM